MTPPDENAATEHDELRILVVDDSALYRQSISRALHQVSGVRIVGTAANGVDAINKTIELQPDLMTLDVEMPEMDGIETLRELNRRRLPVSAIMVSSLTESGAQVTLDALFEGAFDFIHKPTGGFVRTQKLLEAALTEKVGAFRVQRDSRARNTNAARTDSRAPIAPNTNPSVCDLVLIGLSTGGPQALRHVLPRIESDFPVPIVIVQHMPPHYTKTMAERLDQVSPLTMREANDGDALTAGTIFLAPGNKHLQLHRNGSHVSIRLTDDPPENSCRPAVDFTIRSATECFGGNMLAVIMTGMGKDGLKGCQQLHDLGGVIFAQDEASSAVFGMPKAVIGAKLAKRVLPLGKIAASITRHVRRTIRSR